MSAEDRKVCMVDDMEGLTPLAEAYARARGRWRLCSKAVDSMVVKLVFFIDDMPVTHTF